MTTVLDIELLKSEEFLKYVDKLTENYHLSPEKVTAEIESVKNETCSHNPVL